MGKGKSTKYGGNHASPNVHKAYEKKQLDDYNNGRDLGGYVETNSTNKVSRNKKNTFEYIEEYDFLFNGSKKGYAPKNILLERLGNCNLLESKPDNFPNNIKWLSNDYLSKHSKDEVVTYCLELAKKKVLY